MKLPVFLVALCAAVLVSAAAPGAVVAQSDERPSSQVWEEFPLDPTATPARGASSAATPAGNRPDVSRPPESGSPSPAVLVALLVGAGLLGAVAARTAAHRIRPRRRVDSATAASLPPARSAPRRPKPRWSGIRVKPPAVRGESSAAAPAEGKAKLRWGLTKPKPAVAQPEPMGAKRKPAAAKSEPAAAQPQPVAASDAKRHWRPIKRKPAANAKRELKTAASRAPAVQSTASATWAGSDAPPRTPRPGAPPSEGHRLAVPAWESCRIKLHKRPERAHFFAIPFEGGPVLARSPYFSLRRGEDNPGLSAPEALRALVEEMIGAGWRQTGTGRAPWDLTFERGTPHEQPAHPRGSGSDPRVPNERQDSSGTAIDAAEGVDSEIAEAWHVPTGQPLVEVASEAAKSVGRGRAVNETHGGGRGETPKEPQKPLTTPANASGRERSGPPEWCWIVCARSDRKSEFHLVVMNASGQRHVVAKSPPFRARRSRPIRRHGEAQAAYDLLVADLIESGWRPVRAAGPWHETAFIRAMRSGAGRRARGS